MREARVVEVLARTWSRQMRQTVLFSDFSQGILFLILWAAWRENINRPTRLHVIGLLPGLPDRNVFQQALETKLASLGCPQLLPHVQNLLSVWPLNLPGLHRLEFESGALTLTLGVGPIDVMWNRLRARVDHFVLNDTSLLFKAGSLAAHTAQALILHDCDALSQQGVCSLDVVPVPLVSLVLIVPLTHGCKPLLLVLPNMLSWWGRGLPGWAWRNHSPCAGGG